MRLAMLAGVAVVGLLLTAGPRAGSLGLYRLGTATIPGFRNMRDPSRAVLFVHLAGAMLAGCGAHALARRLGRAGLGVAAGLLGFALSAAWRAPFSMLAMPVGSDLPGAYAFLARCGGGDPLLELPPTTFNENWLSSEPMFFSTYHWLPILNGRASYPPSQFKEIARLAQQIPRTRAVARLRTLTGLRWLLIHCGAEPPISGEAVALCADDVQVGRSMRRFGADRLFDLGPVAELPRSLVASPGGRRRMRNNGYVAVRVDAKARLSTGHSPHECPS